MSTKKYRIRLTTDEQQERYLQKVCKQSGGVPSL